MPLIKKVHKPLAVNPLAKPGPLATSPGPQPTQNLPTANVDTANVDTANINTGNGNQATPQSNWSGITTKLDWSNIKLRSVHEKAIVIAFNTDIVADMNRKLASGPGKFPPTAEQEIFLSELQHGVS